MKAPDTQPLSPDTVRAVMVPEPTPTTVESAVPPGDNGEVTSVKRRRRRRRDIGAALGACWLILIVAAAVFADLLPLPSPSEVTDAYSLRPFQTGAHILGTDELGRDELSRAIYGARVSLSVALGATLIALVSGTALGIAAGYFRGALDTTFDIGTSTVLAFPPLILLIALVAVMDPSTTTLTIGLGIVGAPTFVRIARANTIAFANREFVTAAKSLGAGHLRIIIREILPNVVLPVLSFATVVAAGLVVAEGSLSFLGLGIPPPAPSWGGMIAAGRESLYEAPYLVLVPGTFFFLTVFSLNRLGDWARGRIGKESSL
ncbi:putative ABC transporter permease protein [Gordonia terrae NBRC 100016]|nr:putative ABC transporter permease protein [Gordonia terrae NBRC 100016]VTR09610.1 ABC-type dipeptide/oligopeptide/nickel transport systems, permease components [Clostridioides difficile]VTS29968.1 Glutathione transport system permease protein gsiD [Gordonia terrae]